MKKVWITILGIINIILGSSTLGLRCYGWISKGEISGDFIWDLPLLIPAILALICGIFTLKKRSWKWAVAGLVVASVGGIYILILLWILSWTMA
jgi:hypothetical protein